jgi:hypothetical protein
VQVAGAHRTVGQAAHDDVGREQGIREAVAASVRCLACLQDSELVRESVERGRRRVSLSGVADMLELDLDVGRAEEPARAVSTPLDASSSATTAASEVFPTPRSP